MYGNNSLDTNESEQKVNRYWNPVEKLTWENICLARAFVDTTQLYEAGDGSIIALSSIDASKGKTPRTTVHFTLNHLVTSHFGGDWASSGLILLCPGEDFVNENGNPENLSGVDTFWSKSVKIPKTSTFIFVEDNELYRSLVDRHANVVFLDNERIKNLREELKESGKRLSECSPEDFEEYQENNSHYRRILAELNQILIEEVKAIIEHSGYVYFYGDHGHYMDEPFGSAISELGVREKIKARTSHAYTSFGYLELGTGWSAQPMSYLSSFTNEELMANNYEKLKDVLNVLADSAPYLEEPMSSGEVNQQSILSALIYYRLKEMPDLLGNREITETLTKVFEAIPIVKNNILAWSEAEGAKEIMEFIVKK